MTLSHDARLLAAIVDTTVSHHDADSMQPCVDGLLAVEAAAVHFDTRVQVRVRA